MSEPEHSRLGASGAERWMNCPGSGVILKRLSLPETDEPEYRANGIAAHEAASHCLQQGIDAWEIVDEVYHGVTVDDGMAKAIQLYLNECRKYMTPSATTYIEFGVGSDPEKRPHPQFYGRLDFGAYDTDETTIIDYKHGEGIVVEPENNAQLMYYAYGLLISRTTVRSDRLVRLVVVQPRAWHHDGPVREWETTAGEIIHWAESELLPAMQRAELDVTLEAGPWCRFCPAKLFCPMLMGLFGAAARMDPNVIPNFGQQALAQNYALLPAVKFAIKAIEDETYRRNSLGNTVPGTKLINKRAFRIWDGSGEALAVEQFGPEAYEPKAVKSPAELEKLSAAAKKFVKEHAYMPNTGLTIAPSSDPKPEVKVPKAADVFAHLIKAGDDEAQR